MESVPAKECLAVDASFWLNSTDYNPFLHTHLRLPHKYHVDMICAVRDSLGGNVENGIMQKKVVSCIFAATMSDKRAEKWIPWREKFENWGYDGVPASLDVHEHSWIDQ
jgi:hypothetical protein